MPGCQQLYSREAYLEVVLAHKALGRLLHSFSAALRVARTVQAEGASEQLRAFAVRARVLYANLAEVLAVANPMRGKPLSQKEALNLTMHLNSLYLHICGALDNLAWSIAHELRILSRFSHNGRPVQQRVSLFHKDFLRELSTSAPGVAALARSRGDWYAALKRLRDPVAHQVPLVAVPAILVPPEAQRWRQTSDEAMVAANRGDLDEAKHLFTEMETIGSYVPIFAYSHADTEGMRGLWPQVHVDVVNMCEIAERVIAALKPVCSSK